MKWKKIFSVSQLSSSEGGENFYPHLRNSYEQTDIMVNKMRQYFITAA